MGVPVEMPALSPVPGAELRDQLEAVFQSLEVAPLHSLFVVFCAVAKGEIRIEREKEKGMR